MAGGGKAQKEQKEQEPAWTRRSRNQPGAEGAGSNQDQKEQEPTWFSSFKEEFRLKFATLPEELMKQISDVYDKKIQDVKDVAEDAIAKTVLQNEKIVNLEQENQELKHEVSTFKQKLLNLEAQTKRENLVFQSILPDAPTETWKSAEERVRNLLKQYKFYNGNEVEIEWAQRVGQFKPGKCRPIVVKFSFYKTRDQIWRERTNLRGSNVFVSEDYPKEILQKRNVLYPILRAAQKEIEEKRETGGTDLRKVSLKLDKLLLNGRLYSVDELDKLPERLRPENLSTKSENGITVFYSKESIFSNFNMRCPINIENTTYNCTEQYFQYQKAMTFGDDVTADKILQAESPFLQKQFSKDIKGYVHDDWIKKEREILYKANLAKYEQNPVAREALFRTGNNQLGEASLDKKWGTGVKIESTLATDTKSWNGQNHFGQLLMDIRKQLITQND